MMEGNESMGTMKRADRSLSMSAPPVRTAARLNYVASAPEVRPSGQQTNFESAREPKFFGTVPKGVTETVGVRCGGFQRLDWPSQNARPMQAADKTEKKRSAGGSRDQSRNHGHSTSTGSA